MAGRVALLTISNYNFIPIIATKILKIFVLPGFRKTLLPKTWQHQIGLWKNGNNKRWLSIVAEPKSSCSARNHSGSQNLGSSGILDKFKEMKGFQDRQDLGAWW